MDKEISKFIIEANDDEKNKFIDFLRQFAEANKLIDLISESE
jgi:hypothetical protein